MVLKTGASAEVVDIVYVNTVPYYGHSCKWVYGEKERLQTAMFVLTLPQRYNTINSG